MRLRARGLAAAEERDFWLMLIPELLGLLLLFVGPFAAVIGISTLNWDGLTTPRFVGTGNYAALFHDNIFWLSLYNTVYYTVLSVGVGTILAFSVALLWNQPIRGMPIYRTLFYVPVIIPAVSAGIAEITRLGRCVRTRDRAPPLAYDRAVSDCRSRKAALVWPTSIR